MSYFRLCNGMRNVEQHGLATGLSPRLTDNATDRLRSDYDELSQTVMNVIPQNPSSVCVRLSAAVGPSPSPAGLCPPD